MCPPHQNPPPHYAADTGGLQGALGGSRRVILSRPDLSRVFCLGRGWSLEGLFGVTLVREEGAQFGGGE